MNMQVGLFPKGEGELGMCKNGMLRFILETNRQMYTVT
jgi:hypothetical protein